MKESSPFLPILPDFLPLFPDFWQFVCCQGGHSAPLTPPPIGYATAYSIPSYNFLEKLCLHNFHSKQTLGKTKIIWKENNNNNQPNKQIAPQRLNLLNHNIKLYPEESTTYSHWKDAPHNFCYDHHQLKVERDWMICYSCKSFDWVIDIRRLDGGSRNQVKDIQWFIEQSNYNVIDSDVLNKYRSAASSIYFLVYNYVIKIYLLTS